MELATKGVLNDIRSESLVRDGEVINLSYVIIPKKLR